MVSRLVNKVCCSFELFNLAERFILKVLLTLNKAECLARLSASKEVLGARFS